MDCRKKSQPNIVSTLLFKRKSLIYDIENYAFVEGDIMPEQNHGQHQVFDVAQDGNKDIVTRVLNLAYAQCVESLYPYTKSPCVEGEDLFDRLVAPEYYVIELSLPADFSRSTLVLLKHLIHRYFTCCVLYEWMSITNPAVKDAWMERVEDAKAQIKGALRNRRRPIRIRQHPF